MRTALMASCGHITACGGIIAQNGFTYFVRLRRPAQMHTIVDIQPVAGDCRTGGSDPDRGIRYLHRIDGATQRILAKHRSSCFRLRQQVGRHGRRNQARRYGVDSDAARGILQSRIFDEGVNGRFGACIGKIPGLGVSRPVTSRCELIECLRTQCAGSRMTAFTFRRAGDRCSTMS